MDTDATGENPDDNGGFPMEPQDQSGRSSKASKSKYRDGREMDEESERSHRGRRGRRHRNRDESENEEGGERRRSKRSSGIVEQRSVKITRQGGVNTDDDRDEIIDVQIIPQDDNWGDNTTAITGTSDRSSDEDLSRFIKDDFAIGFDCTRYFGIVLAGVLSLAGFVSPIIFVVLPSVMWDTNECGTSCDGLFISMAFKLFILLIGSWALFFRKPKATMPRMYLFRLFVMALIFILLLAYWLFFIMRVVLRKDADYHGVVSYAVSLTDALLFMHYIAVIIFELRHLHPVYVLKVVRSPDGMSKHYSIGQLTIQRTAVFVLENYYRDFEIFNSHLLRVPTTSRVAQKLSSFKVYDVDGGIGNDSVTGHSRAIMTTAAHRRDQNRNERFYEEQEWDRRMKKRKARLIVATEEAFTHIKRVHEDAHPGGGQSMDPLEAAQSIFPSIARPLQKFLRITRQQPRWPMDAVMDHLALCISYSLAPRSFLEAFFEPGPNIQLLEHSNPATQGWELCSDTVVNRPLKEGTTFQLRQGEVLLQVFVMRIPHYKLREEVYDYKRNRFALRLQSETSV